MLKTSSNSATAPVAKFTQRTTAETLEELNRPIDPRHFKTRKQGNITLTEVDWFFWIGPIVNF
jgi:hypothetical protein